MQITDVRIRIMRDCRMKAVASITIDEEFVVHDIKIFEGERGHYISMPSKEVHGEQKDIAHPITSQTRKRLTAIVLDAYEQELAKVQEEAQEAASPDDPDAAADAEAAEDSCVQADE